MVFVFIDILGEEGIKTIPENCKEVDTVLQGTKQSVNY